MSAAKRNYHGSEFEGFICASEYVQEGTGLVACATDDTEDFDAPAGARFARILPTDGDIIVRVQHATETGANPDAGSVRILEGTTEWLPLPPGARLRIRGLGDSVDVNLVWVCVGPNV